MCVCDKISKYDKRDDIKKYLCTTCLEEWYNSDGEMYYGCLVMQQSRYNILSFLEQFDHRGKRYVFFWLNRRLQLGVLIENFLSSGSL